MGSYRECISISANVSFTLIVIDSQHHRKILPAVRSRTRRIWRLSLRMPVISSFWHYSIAQFFNFIGTSEVGHCQLGDMCTERLHAARCATVTWWRFSLPVVSFYLLLRIIFLPLTLVSGVNATISILDRLVPELNASTLKLDTNAQCLVPTSELGLSSIAINTLYKIE